MKLAWKIASVVVSFMALADAIALTVIVAMKQVRISGPGIGRAEEEALFKANGKPNPVYRHNAYCVASAVIIWPAVVFSFVRYVLFCYLCPWVGV